MSLIRDTYYRFQLLIHETAKFGVVGIVGAIVQFAIQTPLHLKFGMGAITSQLIAIIIAIVVTYLGNRYWAFKHRKTDNVPRESMIFVVMSVIGTGIQLGVTAIGTYGLNYRDGISYTLMTCVGIGLGTLFRLFAYRKFVFLAQPGSIEAESLEAEPSR
ncbi:MAG TPA: GtrA family protein [Trebonia sp.]|nr:GtrA family protein [Trebonia sp.]